MILIRIWKGSAMMWFDSATEWVKNRLVALNLEESFEHAGISIDEISAATVLFGVGIIAGFIIKKYFKLVLFGTVCVILSVRWLELRGLVTIDWALVNQSFGVEALPTAQVQEILKSSFEWAKVHVASTISALIGFYLGFRAG